MTQGDRSQAEPEENWGGGCCPDSQRGVVSTAWRVRAPSPGARDLAGF